MGLARFGSYGNPGRGDSGCLRIYRRNNVLASRLGRFLFGYFIGLDASKPVSVRDGLSGKHWL